MKRNFISLLLLIAFLLPIGGNARSEEVTPTLTPTPNSTVALSARNQYSVLDLHNRARCQLDVAAAAMPKVTWNNLLYKVAQNYANKCVFEHNANRSSEYAALGGEGYVGENIFIIWTPNKGIYLANAVKAFASEKANFSYVPSCSSGLCGCKPGTVCGHYTQLIWASSRTVACAQSDCTNTSLGGQFVVCNYAPGGNYVGSAPYKAATETFITGACQAARRIPLRYLSLLLASSGQSSLPNVLDNRLSTYWAPSDADPAPYITIALEQPLNVDTVKVRWYDINHAAKAIKVEYSTQADGSGLTALPPQTLPLKSNVTINVKQSQIRFLKITFLEPYSLKILVSKLEAMDPTFSWKW